MRSVRDPSSSSPNNSPEILVESHNSNGTISSIVSLLLPNSLLDSWQWVGGVFNTPPVDNVTLRLAVRPDQSQNGNSDGTGNGNAYFDDLCVSSTLTSNDTVTPTPGVALNDVISFLWVIAQSCAVCVLHTYHIMHV